MENPNNFAVESAKRKLKTSVYQFTNLYSGIIIATIYVPTAVDLQVYTGVLIRSLYIHTRSPIPDKN